MKGLQKIGLGIFLLSLTIFISLLFIGKYEIKSNDFKQFNLNKGIKSELFINQMNERVVGIEYSNSFSFSSEIISMMESSNEMHQNNNEWDKVIWDKSHSFSYQLAKISGKGVVFENKVLFWWLTFGLGILGSLLFMGNE